VSQVLIQQYLNPLRGLRKYAGTSRESVVREAFKDLLKGPSTYSKPIKTASGSSSIARRRWTVFRGEAWEYRLGNRCALEWILDQHKEKKPTDPTSARSLIPIGLPITKKKSSTCCCA
jgi:hypothetical protein